LDLGKQLLILLTFVAGGVPGQTADPAPEELVLQAYKSLGALFLDLSSSPGGPMCLVETSTVPALGHCVTVILDGITDGASPAIQAEALQSLKAVWRCVKDLQALSSFLPGTVSALTKCLTPTTSNRRSRKTIITALEVLQHVFVSILSDIRTRTIRDPGKKPAQSEVTTLTKSWLNATAAQIKLALSNIIKLRSHESDEVRKALNKLSLTILDECHDSLPESGSMLVETCMTLSGLDTEDGSLRETTLTDLAMIHSDIGEIIKGTVYNWATSLPRIMQANDETAKRVMLGQLSKAHKLLMDLNLDSSILEDTLVNSLRDSVTATMDISESTRVLQETEFDLNSQAAMTLVSDGVTITKFRPIIMPEESQRETRLQLARLLESFGTRESQINMASQMLEYVRGASGPSLLSAYWLSSQLLRSATVNNQELDQFFTSDLTSSDRQAVVNQELFSYSLSVLSSTDDEKSDWRLQAIALEVMADTAQTMKEGFRTELVDTLYLIAQLLGSPNSQLREHAITTLNIVSKSCDYESASDLIIGNVDYMVNAISLRLNTFDISPQAPKVLIMMIRLAGPSLLLYLDDVVSSIFAALDNFHGYQYLVDILFSVLGEIVAVGSKSNQLQIESGIPVSHCKTPPAAPTISSILALVPKKYKLDTDPLRYEPFPKQPWKDATTRLDEAENISDEEEDEESDEPPSEIAKPAPTKTYVMLQSIARLSQHHLTSPSPILRAKLLNLARIASTALQHNEDAFLPLLNDIWPVVMARLYDEEPYVAIAAADTVAELCRCAGDFLASRILNEWSGLMLLVRKTKEAMGRERKGNAGRGIFSQIRQLWEGILRLLVSIVECVRLDDEMFDEVLGILRDLVVAREDVRSAFEVVNSDSVWLALQIIGENKPLEIPIVEGYRFASLDCR
jgi:hypothetical protein